MKHIPIHNAEFVCLSDLIPEDWGNWLLMALSEQSTYQLVFKKQLKYLSEMIIEQRAREYYNIHKVDVDMFFERVDSIDNHIMFDVTQ